MVHYIVFRWNTYDKGTKDASMKCPSQRQGKVQFGALISKSAWTSSEWCNAPLLKCKLKVGNSSNLTNAEQVQNVTTTTVTHAAQLSYYASNQLPFKTPLSSQIKLSSQMIKQPPYPEHMHISDPVCMTAYKIKTGTNLKRVSFTWTPPPSRDTQQCCLFSCHAYSLTNPASSAVIG